MVLCPDGNPIAVDDIKIGDLLLSDGGRAVKVVEVRRVPMSCSKSSKRLIINLEKTSRTRSFHLCRKTEVGFAYEAKS